MSVIAISGLPGSGKTLFATYLMKRKYKKENFLKGKRIINNIYSNYPIMLTNNFKGLKKVKLFEKKYIKKFNKEPDEDLLNDLRVKYNNYSRKIDLFDLAIFQRYIPDCDIVFDEIQSYFDSLDYKDIPRTIVRTFQFHRHFDIHDIYLLSQDPSRIPKQFRQLVNEFYRIKKFIKIPFTGIAFIRYYVYYKDEDYGKSIKVKKDEVTYEFRTGFKFFRYKKVFNSYDTKYLRSLVKTENLLETNIYNNLEIEKNVILSRFEKIDNIKKKPTFAPRKRASL